MRIKTNGIHQNKQNHLVTRLDEIREVLRSRDPFALADRTGASYQVKEPGKGTFTLPIWDQELIISFPDLSIIGQGVSVNILIEALTLYYLLTSNGNPEQEQWIAFSDLPDGRFYSQAFQGYTGAELTRYFENDLDKFGTAAYQSRGVEHSIGDRAFLFRLFPNVSLVVVGWYGDDDFPPNYQILFNASAPNHLPTDVCAIAGNMLTRKLLQVK